MSDALFQAYSSLFLWIGLGVLCYRLLPHQLPHWLGRGLFWVGMPVEIFTLARHTDFSGLVWLAPAATVSTLVIGLSLAFGLLQLHRQGFLQSLGSASEPSLSLYPESDPDGLGATLNLPQQGSFMLSSILGNTGFVGLAIASKVLSPENLGVAAFFTVMHNVMGLYGVGVLVSHHFGESTADRRWWKSLLAVVKVPSLWAFVLGVTTQPLLFSPRIESWLSQSVWVVIPCGFLLMGMRLSQIRNWHDLTSGLVPTLVKMVLMPTTIAIATSLLGIGGEPRLALVLMAGTPTALTTLVLAEEYNLDRSLISSSIALSMLALIPMVPLWVKLLH